MDKTVPVLGPGCLFAVLGFPKHLENTSFGTVIFQVP